MKSHLTTWKKKERENGLRSKDVRDGKEIMFYVCCVDAHVCFM